MNEICVNCWNNDCKENEELRENKFEFCQYMKEHPEEFEDEDI